VEHLYIAVHKYCKNVSYSRKCDIWSTGCVIYETLFGSPPFYAKSEVALVEKIMEGQLDIPKENTKGKISEPTRDLLSKMLNAKEEGRYNWNQIKLDPAIKTLKVKYLS